MAAPFADIAGIGAGARHVDRAVAVGETVDSLPPQSPSAAEERHDESEHHAHDNTGNDREVEGGASAFDANVTGQASEPAGAESVPEEETDDHDRAAENNQHSAKVAHTGRYYIAVFFQESQIDYYNARSLRTAARAQKLGGGWQ